MLSPLKPLLCRHDFYWSERHLSDRCRRCGKLQAAEALDVLSGRSLGAALAERSAISLPQAPVADDTLPELPTNGAGSIPHQNRRICRCYRGPASKC